MYEDEAEGECEGECEIDVEIARQQAAVAEERAEEVMIHVETKGIHDLLECTLDVMVTEEFGSGACLYHNYVCIIAYDAANGRVGFGVLHPADDKDKCPPYEPNGFSVPWEFDPKETAKRIRRLALEANVLYKKLGIEVVPPLEGDVIVPEMFMRDDD